VAGYNFVAFSYFEVGYRNLQKYNISHCEETQVGWYSTADGSRFGCWYGVKAPGSVPTVPVHREDHTSLASTKKATVVSALEHQREADRLNLIQTSWRAAVPSSRFLGKTVAEMNVLAGIKRSLKRAELRDQVALQRSVGSFLQGSSRASLEAQATRYLKNVESRLPTDFSWHNNSGRNFLEPVMDQGQCGSCYAVSAARMLTARHKVAVNNTKEPPFSISYPLFCSEYNQGCNGGYGFLLAKWSEEIGLLPASCMRYRSFGEVCPPLTCDVSKLNKRYRASKPRYVGGYYGATTAAEMMLELYHGGPISAGLEPSSDFMYYDSGIYRSTNKNATAWSERTEWQQVDHAVLLVGWGEENGQKYWLLQNSWGTDWGENGYFRMVRGENDSSVETIAEAADVVEDEAGGSRAVSQR